MRSNASQRRKTKKQKNYKISVLFPRSRVISKSGTIYAVILDSVLKNRSLQNSVVIGRKTAASNGTI